MVNLQRLVDMRHNSRWLHRNRTIGRTHVRPWNRRMFHDRDDIAHLMTTGCRAVLVQVHHPHGAHCASNWLCHRCKNKQKNRPKSIISTRMVLLRIWMENMPLTSKSDENSEWYMVTIGNLFQCVANRTLWNRLPSDIFQHLVHPNSLVVVIHREQRQAYP